MEINIPNGCQAIQRTTGSAGSLKGAGTHSTFDMHKYVGSVNI